MEQIKPLAVALVDVEGVQDVAALAGVDLVHAGVLLEHLVHPALIHDPQLSGEFQRLTVRTHGGQGDLAGLHQLLVEGLALGGDDVHPVVLRQHHVDDPGLGMALGVHRGGGGDLHLAEQVNVFLGFLIHGNCLPAWFFWLYGSAAFRI